MAKKTEIDIERAKQRMEMAHVKRMGAIDRTAAKAKGLEEASYRTKMRVLDKAAERISAATAAAAAKAGDVTATVSHKAADLASTVATTTSDMTEAVGGEAGKLGERAGEIRAKAGRRMQQQPWIVAVAAALLLVVLSMSVGRRYFRQM